MNVVADDRMSHRFNVIHTRLDCDAQIPNEQVQFAEELTGDVESFMSDTSEADSLVQSAGTAFRSVPGRANRKTHFCRTPIGANPNFRRIAMG